MKAKENRREYGNSIFLQERKDMMLSQTTLEAREWRVVEFFRVTGLSDCFDMVCGREKGLVRMRMKIPVRQVRDPGK